MLSGEKKKYSPYLDTGLMEEAGKRANALGVSTNEFITQALISYIEDFPDKNIIALWVQKLFESPNLKTVLIEELTRYAGNK